MKITPEEQLIGKKAPGNRGFVAAEFSQTAVVAPIAALNMALTIQARKNSKLSKGDSVELSKAIQNGLKDSGLYDKGVRVYRIKEKQIVDGNYIKESLKDIKNIYSKNVKVSKKAFNNLQKRAQELLQYDKKDKRALSAIQKELAPADLKNAPEQTQQISSLFAKIKGITYKEGMNALYLPKANKIITPDKHFTTFAFHEMGHALNNNGVLKALQKIRPLSLILPTYILLASLLNKRKVNDIQDEKDSKFQRGMDFIKRNAVKLTAAATLPMLAEEGIASIRGQNIAKKLLEEGSLSKDLYNKIKQTNIAGFSTYALSALGFVVGAKVAVSLKDKIQKNYEEKMLQKRFDELNKANMKIK